MRKIILAIILLTIISGCARESTLDQTMDKWGTQITSANNFSIIEKNIIKNEDNDITRLYASGNQGIIKILRIIGVNNAEAYLNAEMRMLSSSFNEQKSPYPGPLSNTIKCPEEYIPKVTEENDTEVHIVRIKLYSTNRLTFGACTDDSTSYKATVLLVNCKQKMEAYKIEYFTPKEEEEAEIEFKCQKTKLS